jgi:hypothetical protein
MCRYGSRFLDLKEIGNCAQVSKAWSRAMDDYVIWLSLFEREKIPLIEGRKLKAKEDFKFMRPITVSKRDAAYFGEFVGKAPVMSEKTFKRLKFEKDAFEPTKDNHETHVVVVEPTHFLRPYDPDLSKRLLENGDFSPDNIIDQKTMMIPNSTKNLIILAEESWNSSTNLITVAEESWKNDKELYDEYTVNGLPEILKECNKVSKMVNVHVLRIDSPKITAALKYSHQRQLLQKRDYEVAPFSPRFYFNMLQLFKMGTCPDHKYYASITSDLVRLVDLNETEEVGEELFTIYTVGMGRADCPDTAFPMISVFPADEKDRDEGDIRAAAVFSAELGVSKAPSDGSQRTLDATLVE